MLGLKEILSLTLLSQIIGFPFPKEPNKVTASPIQMVVFDAFALTSTGLPGLTVTFTWSVAVQVFVPLLILPTIDPVTV